jgi:DNA primase
MGVVDEIKERLDIVDLISGYMSLKKAGRNYKGLCPFHTEKTPSFVVFPDTQSWHCFGACSTGGDIFGFVMRRENMDFSEALRFLAEKAGVELRPLDQAAQKQRSERDRLREVNAAAAQYYHNILMDSDQGVVGKRYFEHRGVTRETMAAFQLGYAPDEWHALGNHLKNKFDPKDALMAGLAVKNERGDVYDRFRGRVVFPIRDLRGHVIGFGGRVLDDSVPKYVNTPQTPLFDKGSLLYGIDLAREHIRESETAIIVEGYMDVIIPFQCGVKNLVACMGTALTEAHIKVLKRMTKTLIFALDPDEAGMRAVEKGVETARQTLEQRVVPVPTATGLIRYEEQLDAEIRVLMLPDGLDPDELILQDRERWDRLIDDALPVADYFFELVFQEEDISTARGKRQAVDRLLPVIAVMSNPVERTHYLQRLSRQVRVNERELLPRIGQLRAQGGRGSRSQRARRQQTSPPVEQESGGPRLSLEDRCLALLLQEPRLLPIVVERTGLSAETFHDVRNRQIFDSLERFLSTSSEHGISEIRAGLDSALDAHVESLLQRLQVGPSLSAEMVQEDLMKCSSRLRKSYFSRLIDELRFLIQDAQEQGLKERARELDEMIERLRRDHLQIDHRFYAETLVGRRRIKDDVVSHHDA